MRRSQLNGRLAGVVKGEAFRGRRVRRDKGHLPAGRQGASPAPQCGMINGLRLCSEFVRILCSDLTWRMLGSNLLIGHLGPA